MILTKQYIDTKMSNQNITRSDNFFPYFGDTNITEISDYSFTDCVQLKNFTITENCKKLGQYAFKNCQNLSSINIENISSISHNCFYNTGISQLNLKSISSLNVQLCFNCQKLKYVNLSNLTDLTVYNTFGNCQQLVSVNFNGLSSLTINEDQIVFNSSNLSIIEFPNLKNINGYLGKLNYNHEINIIINNDNVKTIDNNMIIKSNNDKCLYYMHKNYQIDYLSDDNLLSLDNYAIYNLNNDILSISFNNLIYAGDYSIKCSDLDTCMLKFLSFDNLQLLPYGMDLPIEEISLKNYKTLTRFDEEQGCLINDLAERLPYDHFPNLSSININNEIYHTIDNGYGDANQIVERIDENSIKHLQYVVTKCNKLSIETNIIEPYVLLGNDYLTSITFKNLSSIENNALAQLYNLQEIYFKFDKDQKKVVILDDNCFYENYAPLSCYIPNDDELYEQWINTESWNWLLNEGYVEIFKS